MVGTLAAEKALAAGWEPIQVRGASVAAYRAAESPTSSGLIATVGENSLEVTSRFSDRAQEIALAEALLVFLASQ